MQHNIDTIAYDAIKKIGEEDLRIISGQDQTSNRVWFDIAVTRWIRNEYGLWHDSPLTAVWRDNPDTRRIIDGVDHSYWHPDAVSNRIYKFMQQYLSYYPGRKVHVYTYGVFGRQVEGEYEVVKRTKSGLIEVCHPVYKKVRQTVHPDRIAFVDQPVEQQYNSNIEIITHVWKYPE